MCYQAHVYRPCVRPDHPASLADTTHTLDVKWMKFTPSKMEAVMLSS